MKNFLELYSAVWSRYFRKITLLLCRLQLLSSCFLCGFRNESQKSKFIRIRFLFGFAILHHYARDSLEKLEPVFRPKPFSVGCIYFTAPRASSSIDWFTALSVPFVTDHSDNSGFRASGPSNLLLGVSCRGMVYVKSERFTAIGLFHFYAHYF